MNSANPECWFYEYNNRPGRINRGQYGISAEKPGYEFIIQA